MVGHNKETPETVLNKGGVYTGAIVALFKVELHVHLFYK